MKLSRGWWSRGYLPHFDSAPCVQHVTYRLADSLPSLLLARIEEELRAVPREGTKSERRRRIEDWIDRGLGSCLLRDPAAACLVQNALLHFDSQRYRLLAWVVMPNHVHVLLEVLSPWSLSRIVASWKSFTGRQLSLHRTGSGLVRVHRRIWHREYWDRFIRDEVHLEVARHYIHQNPVKAGLVRKAEEWEWSSARRMGDG